MIRVPGKDGISLQSVQADGDDVRIVYSVMDALDTARTHPKKDVVFFAIGFETTTPPTALALQIAKTESLKNFFVSATMFSLPGQLRGFWTIRKFVPWGRFPLMALSDPPMLALSLVVNLTNFLQRNIKNRWSLQASNLWIFCKRFGCS